MRIFVVAKAGAKKEFTKKVDATHFRVAVSAVPQDGRANNAIIRSLADYFKIAPSRIRLVAGVASTRKVFDIL